MKDQATISSLKRKRAEISGQIRDLETRRSVLMQSLEAVDATLALYAPSFNPETIEPKRSYTPGIYFKRLQLYRLVTATLRDAPWPMTRDEIAAAIIRSKGMDAKDRVAVRTISSRIQKILVGMQTQSVISEQTHVSPPTWAVICSAELQIADLRYQLQLRSPSS